MGNEGSQIQSSGDGTRTPMSDSGLSLGATPREVPRVRRLSNASTQPPSPVEPPDLDMSHLSETEKQQIEAVIARARQLQAEEQRRVREIEEEFGPLSASVPVNLSAVGPPPKCPLCKDVELKGELQNVCATCETTVCLNCGVYDTNPTTKLQEWLCSTCNERRHLTADVEMWCNGQQDAPDFDTFLEMEQPVGRGMRRTTSLPDSALDSEESERQYAERRDVRAEGDRRKPTRSDWEDGSREMAARRHDPKAGAPNQSPTHGQRAAKQKPVPPPKPDLSRRPSQESATGRRQVTGTDDTQRPAAINQPARTRGVGQSPDSDRDSIRPSGLRVVDVDSGVQVLEDEEAVSPGGTRRRQRPQHLILSKQHNAGSAPSTSSSSGSFDSLDRERPSGESSDGATTDLAKPAPEHKTADLRSQPRAGAEGAEVMQSGTIKKKPSAIDRAGISDHSERDRSLSPSRRSPKSPPRSPSWKRYRESPPRSPTMYSISPSMSPTERFPSTFVERTSPSLTREEAYGEDFGPPSARDHTTFSFDQHELTNYNLNDQRAHPDRPPPKPARLVGQYQFEDEFSTELTPHALDLATYAATVASDTAHLTNMSVSPTCNLHVPEGADPEYLEASPEGDSISPPSPNYFEDVDDEIDMNEPTPKSIDYQNTKRQRAKPPATDWSPVTDLSPILDVSPSIEKLEQEKMLAEQERQLAQSDSDLLFDSPPCTIKRRPKPQPAVAKPRAPDENQSELEIQDDMQSPLKRYQAFDDISRICVPGESPDAAKAGAIRGDSQTQEQDHRTKELDANTPDLIHCVRPNKESNHSKEVERNLRDTSQKMKDGDSLRDTPTRPDLCTDKNGSSKEDRVWIQKRPPIREELIEERRMVMDSELIESGKRTKRFADDGSRKPPGSKADEYKSRDRSAIENEVKNNKLYSSPKEKPLHPSLGEMERSSSGESSKSKDSTSSSSKVQSPGSPSDPRKIRRKLPVPPEEADQSEHASGSRSQGSPSSRTDAVDAEKERLRKRLLEKEAEKRKKETAKDMNYRNSRVGRPLVDREAQTQTRTQAIGTMSSGGGLVSIGTNTSSASTTSKSSSISSAPNASPKKKPPKPPPKPKIEFVNIYGLQVPAEIKSLKQRIKEEIQIATTSRRLQIDEREEIRLMERELAEREKERRQRAAEQAKLEAKINEAKSKEIERERELERWRELDKQKKLEAEKLLSEQRTKYESRRRTAPASATLSSLRMSPQASPRRARHKRQNSDPMVAKFSPIEEVRDIENELSYKLGLEARRADTGRFSPQMSRSMRPLGAVTPPSTSDLDRFAFRQPPLSRSALSRSSEVLSKYSLVERDPRLASSQSESDLLMSLTHNAPLSYYEEEEWKLKEERKHILQMEIEKRKRALEENARLQNELRKLSQSAELSRQDIEEARLRYQQHMRKKDRVPTGIIKPIDYDSELTEAEAYSQMEYAAYREMLEKLQQERFLAHHSVYGPDYIGPRDRPAKQTVDALAALGPAGDYFAADIWPDVRHLPPADLYGYPRHKAAAGMMNPYAMSPLFYPGMKESDPLNMMYRAESDHSLAESDDNVMEGGVTLRREKEKGIPLVASQESTPTQQRKYDFPTKRILLTRDPKDRSIKGNGIGMKIVGGKVLPGQDGVMGAYVAAIYPGGVADQLHGELQEGDQVLEWNGIPLTGKTYEEVQRIMAVPNGEIELVVRPGANLCSKHSATMSTLRTDSCHSSYDNLDITTSDYEDLDRYLDNSDGVDPDLLAAQLEDIQGPMASPGASPSSSQQDMYLTPSMSTPGSSDPTDPPSPPAEVSAPRQGAPPSVCPGAGVTSGSKPGQDGQATPKVRKRRDKSGLGEIQLQLSYDDYDGTLNIHVIQARDLRPKDKNGYSDPFVKVYLLPPRIAENKRRTKYISRTLDPEWHQTLVFMKIAHEELVTKTLEVTVWDYDRFKPNDFLGEVLIDLSNEVFLDNKPHWYLLHDHSESTSAKTADPNTLSPPPSSSSSTRSRGGRGPPGGPAGSTGRAAGQGRGTGHGRGTGGQGRGGGSQGRGGGGGGGHSRGSSQGRGGAEHGRQSRDHGRSNSAGGTGSASDTGQISSSDSPVSGPGPGSGSSFPTNQRPARSQSGPALDGRPARDERKPSDSKPHNNRGPHELRDHSGHPVQNVKETSPRRVQPPRSQNISSNQGASKYSPSVGRSAPESENKDRSRRQKQQQQQQSAPRQEQQQQQQLASSQQQQAQQQQHSQRQVKPSGPAARAGQQQRQKPVSSNRTKRTTVTNPQATPSL